MKFFGKYKSFADVALKPDLNAARPRARILVIDDDPNSFPTDILRSEGYNIEHWLKVENISRLESGEFDIIVLDIMGVASHWSPGDGLGILEHLKKRNPAQIIVAFSGQSFDLGKAPFWRLADENLSKPVDALKCKQVIDNLIEARFTPAHYWNGIADLLRTNGVPEKSIVRLEDKVVSAVERGSRMDYAAQFGSLLKAGDVLVTLISLGEKISRLTGH